MRQALTKAMIASAATLLLSACGGMTAQQRDTAIGAGIGAIGGAAITGGSAAGAVGGAAVGGIIGHEVGKDKR